MQLFLLSSLKNTVYEKNLCTIRELKQKILATVFIALEETLAAFVQNFRCLVQMVMDADGAFIENAYM
jgi:hypothetical protein